VNCLEVTPLTPELLPAIVELDRLCLGGLWSLDGYRRELESPNSDLLILQKVKNREWKVKSRRQKTEDEPIVASREDATKEFTDSLPSTPLLLGLGCLWAIADEAHITILAVHPDYRRLGLGQILLITLLKFACQRKLKWATLEVRASNQAAISLYQHFGFQEAGRRKRYYQDNGEDALILWRGGLQQPDFLQTLDQWQHVAIDRLLQAGWTLQSQ